MNFQRRWFRGLHRHWQSLFVSRSKTGALDGWRALAMLLLFGFHALFTVQEVVPFAVFVDFYESTPSSLGWLWAGDRGVDIFFVLSGFLISRILFHEWQRCGCLDIGRFWWRRLLRLAPAYVAVLGVYLAANGPNSHTLAANFFYLNNFVPYADGAMLWSWSLAVEMQFYLLLPLLIALVVRRASSPWLIYGGLLLVAVVWRIIVLLTDEVLIEAEAWQYMLDRPVFEHFFSVVYDNLSTRYGSLLIGVMMAHWLVFSPDGCKVWFGGAWAGRTAWLSIVVVVLMMLPAGELYSVDAHYPEWVKLVFLVLHRYVFSVAIALLMLFSLFGRGKLFDCLSGFFGASFWRPLARLSYSFYLIHLIVIFWFYGVGIEAEHYPALAGGEFIVNGLLALAGLAFVMSLILSLLMYVFIERPFMALSGRKLQGSLAVTDQVTDKVVVQSSR